MMPQHPLKLLHYNNIERVIYKTYVSRTTVRKLRCGSLAHVWSIGGSTGPRFSKGEPYVLLTWAQTYSQSDRLHLHEVITRRRVPHPIEETRDRRPQGTLGLSVRQWDANKEYAGVWLGPNGREDL